MKVLSIKEPYASLIINGYKTYEFRTWKTKYRGKILIHASKTIDSKNKNRFENYNLDIKPGYIIGEAFITDVIYVDEKKYKELLKIDKNVYKNRVNCYAFKLENIKKYKTPIPKKGRLGLWNL